MSGARAGRRWSATRHRSPERWVTAAGLGALAIFQLGLAAGAPWGRASYGGGHPGVLPYRLRRISAGAVPLYAGLAVTVASPRTPVRLRRHLLTGVAGLMGIATVMNAVSPSLPERAIWTPTAAVVGLSAWRARRDG
ncbi:hypothetical protein ACI3EY_01530 [Ornithinimicrobium sp. LYQ92]|uniref:hypothetical protein n=1 Tax=Serinicoccus sp. LYQ92 TaxID=3378798 RepID=UPI0038538DC1